MATINIDKFGLEEAFQNWLSTTVDTINSNCDIIEATFLALGETVNLTRCDTSATSNIKFSNAFNEYLIKLNDSLEGEK